MQAITGARGLIVLPLRTTSTTQCRAAPTAPALLPQTIHRSPNRTFFATPAPQKKKKKEKANSEDVRKTLALKSNLYADAPPPLRMARNRWLRHWTIHRAWLLHQRRVREERERELMRMYQGMNAACEELRKTAGPGTRDKGYLFRVAMERKGVYGPQAIPIEYARAQTETPAREPWNHGWTRD